MPFRKRYPRAISFDCFLQCIPSKQTTSIFTLWAGIKHEHALALMLTTISIVFVVEWTEAQSYKRHWENLMWINIFFLILLAAAILLILVLFSKIKLFVPSQSGVKFEILRPGHHRYTIFVPPTYAGKNRAPLILALHYAGHGTPFYGELILLGLVKPAFEVLNAIIVAPDCPASDWTQPKSEQFIFDLLDSIQAEYSIDPERILITGYSLGGMGTWHFAARYPERFTAAIVMAGMPPKDVLAIDWQIPLMVIHGRNDKVVPINDTKTAVLELEKKKVDITFRVLEGVTHYETHYFVNALQSTIPWLQDRWDKMKI